MVNAVRYMRTCQADGFPLSLVDIHYASDDRFRDAGSVDRHYFLQDLWAARVLHAMRITEHVDVGSRIDGFVAHVLLFARVTYVDIRPLPVGIPGLTYVPGSVLEMPFDDGSIPTISCLHVIEHIGLGRYGDPVCPSGYIKAAWELTRVRKSPHRLQARYGKGCFTEDIRGDRRQYEFTHPTKPHMGSKSL